MMSNDYLSFRRKGITPIIATVLLLGITVAIGLTVYTQAQGMIGNTDTSGIDKVKNTQIALTPVYNNGGEMSLQVRNKGERAINTSKYTIYYGPPNWDPVTFTVLDAQAASSWTPETNECFTGTSQILEPGDKMSCDTGVKFPGALETVQIKIEANNFDYVQTASCRAQTSNAKSCS